jgi:hypothetical protein
MEDDSNLPPLDTPTTTEEVPPAPAPLETQPSENVLEPPKLNNKRKRNPVAMKSIGRRPAPRLQAPPKKKQRIMEGETPAFLKKKKRQAEYVEEDEQFEEDNFLPPEVPNAVPFQPFPYDTPIIPPNGILQGGLGDGASAATMGDAEDNFEGDFNFDGECPFTEEEMNAPLVLPNTNDYSEPKHDQNYNPYVYDQGYDFDARHDDDVDDYYEPQPRKRKHSKKRNKTIRNSATVSLSALLENADGVDPQYCKERKQFYDSLEQFMKRSPDVNLLCGAPVDLYQLYTETYNRGGFDQVCQSKQWRQIFRQLPQYSSTHTSASYALKKMYKKNLFDYEQAQRNGFP